MQDMPERLVLYDGMCGVCDRTVQFVLDHDPHGRFHFAPLQGDLAAAVRSRHPELPAELDSLVLVAQGPEGERVWWYSHAVFRMMSELPAPWRFVGWLRFLPRALTDLGYRAFARVRYRLFGEIDRCRLPSPDEAARFHG